VNLPAKGGGVNSISLVHQAKIPKKIFPDWNLSRMSSSAEVEATSPCELFEVSGEGAKSDVMVKPRFSTAPAQEMQKSNDEETLAEHGNSVACLFTPSLPTSVAGRTLTFRIWRTYLKLMRHDSNPGGNGGFPTTRWSLIVAARSQQTEERQRALNTLIAGYWKPVYKYVRLRWGKDNEQAKDLTQEFFARLLEKDFLENYDLGMIVGYATQRFGVGSRTATTR
jgi:hypothetical protein